MPKICPPDKILNPETGRCISISSKKGMMIWNALPFHHKHLEIVKVIGRGGFGETTLIKDTETGKKYIRKESLNNNDEDMRYQFSVLTELKNKDICQKNFICPVAKYRDKQNRYFIVFDYLDGYDTLTRASSEMSDEMKIVIAKKILKSVKKLHKNGIIHADLKPDNIMVNLTTHDVRIIDFGTAVVEKSPGAKYSLRGYTKFFLPPHFDKRPASFHTLTKNDFWATGMTLYKLIYGSYPKLSYFSSQKAANDKLQSVLKTRTIFF
jgi:serine/threonine protein kinase